MTWSLGNGGTRSCRPASSSAMSVGKRSRRVESICPNLTKIGPSSCKASRKDRARGRPQPAKPLVAEQELVEPVLERDEQNLGQSEQAHAAIVRDGVRYAS